MSQTASFLGTSPLFLASLLAAGAMSACTGPDRNFPEPPASGGSGPGTGSTGDTTSTTTADTTSTSTSTASGDGGQGGSGPSGPGGGGNGGEGGTPSQGGGPSAGGGGAGGEGPVCNPATHACVTDVPAGWAGPMALYEGPTEGSLPGCAGTYPTAVGQYNGELDAGVADCDCTCGAATGITCGGSAQLCYRSSQNGCIQACISPNATIANNTCLNVAVSGPYVQVIGPTPSNMGSCAAQANHVIPTPAWATEAQACSGATTTPLGCDAGEVCAPQVLDGALCIQRGGDVACPDAVWSVKHTLHQSFSDTRACSACSCGGAQSTCGGAVTFSYGGGTCNTDTFGAGSVPSGGCASIADDFAEHAFYQQNPSGTCPAQGGALSGEVTPEGTVTFCCTN